MAHDDHHSRAGKTGSGVLACSVCGRYLTARAQHSSHPFWCLYIASAILPYCRGPFYNHKLTSNSENVQQWKDRSCWKHQPQVHASRPCGLPGDHHASRSCGLPGDHHASRPCGLPGDHHASRSCGLPGDHHASRPCGLPGDHHASRPCGLPGDHHAGKAGEYFIITPSHNKTISRASYRGGDPPPLPQNFEVDNFLREQRIMDNE